MELRKLKLIELRHTDIGDVLRCILHSILFLRASNSICPSDMDCDEFDITYAKCGGQAEDDHVNYLIKNVHDEMIKKSHLQRSVIVSFYEKQVHKGFLGFMSNEVKRYWEHWEIPLEIKNGTIYINGYCY